MLLAGRLSDKAARVAAASSYSSRPGWQLTGMIVKSGDDCRQELLALQLIREFRDIWAGRHWHSQSGQIGWIDI